MRDNLFSNKTDLVDFAFDAKVAIVFDDMVKRSVPGYQTMIEMMGLIAKTYGQNNTYYYDLGASTGAVSLALGLNNTHQNTPIIAVDNAHNMAKKCKANLTGKIPNFSVICADINDISIKNASIVILNLTLQFIPSQQRQRLIDKIYQGLCSGGVMVVCEKIHFDKPHKQNKINQLHLDFKRANGYSELEVAVKRQLLEDVLITDSKQAHFDRFKNAGFETSFVFFQCLSFASFLAIK